MTNMLHISASLPYNGHRDCRVITSEHLNACIIMISSNCHSDAVKDLHEIQQSVYVCKLLWTVIYLTFSIRGLNVVYKDSNIS
jgi:hypothetical protein